MGAGGRSPQFKIEPSFERTKGSEPPIERGIDQTETHQREQHVEGGPEIEDDVGTHLVLPDRGDLSNCESTAGQGVEKVNVKGEVSQLEFVVDGLSSQATDHLGTTLGVRDPHLEECLDKEVEQAAGEPTFAGLEVGDSRVRKPTRTHHAIGTRREGMLDEIEEGVWRGGTVSIDISDEIRPRGEAKTFDQSPAFADRIPELEM